MKRQLALLAALIGLSSLYCQAQSTVDFAAGPGQRDVLGTDATQLDNGNYVSIGFFDPGFDITTFNSDLLALDAAWNEYGGTTIQTIFGQPGRFGGRSSTMDPVFDDEQIYLWIFETSDNSAPTVDYNNVTGYGLYTGAGANWLFPAQGSAFPNNSTSVNSSEVIDDVYGTYDSSHLYLQLIPVPEPTTMALLLLCAASFFLWTRQTKANQ